MQRGSLLLFLGCLFCCVSLLSAQDAPKVSDTPDKARVFITDSQSWETSGYGGGSGGSGGAVAHGGARPQTAEIIKTFGERCPEVMVNNIQEKADYIVLLDHEGGKGLLQHKNKVAVFAKVSGDSIVSKSTVSLGGSVQEACAAISSDWAAHGAAMRSPTATDGKVPGVPSPWPQRLEWALRQHRRLQRCRWSPVRMEPTSKWMAALSETLLPMCRFPRAITRSWSKK